MNVKLLRRVKKHILEEPRRFVMRVFYFRKADLLRETFTSDTHQPMRFAKCGTAACIAGWSVLLTDGLHADMNDVRARAISLLGLNPNDYRHDELFDVCGWPTKFADAYEKARSQKARAKIAADRIEHFIATKGAE
jgi:hypothetical protein